VTDDRPPIIVDACVLIDFASVNPIILNLAAKHIGPVIVTSQVLEEVEEFDEERAAETGLTVIRPDEDLINHAVSHRSNLSTSDKVFFSLARDRGYICWTSDRELRKLCVKHGIKVLWGLEVMLILCEGGHLTRTAALRTARSINRINRYITDEVLADFETKIEGISC
jgi:rRNA-processing protein FCF1